MKWFHCLKFKVENLQKALPSPYEILIISISSPLLVGVYEDGKLIETVENSGKT